MERLHKFIARCGVSSRRAAEELIRTGHVTVNGELVTAMGVMVGEEDIVEVDGSLLAVPKPKYVLLNKPKGYVTTLRDPQRRPTIVKLLPDVGVTLKPVGRLDMDSEGLLLCTNDGEMMQRLTHPKYGVEKEYEAIVRGEVTQIDLDKLKKGVFLDGHRAAAVFASLIRYERSRDTSKIKVVLKEGRNRQVRLMCLAIGHPVVELERVRYAFLTTKGVKRGSARMLSHQEVESLKELVKLQ